MHRSARVSHALFFTVVSALLLVACSSASSASPGNDAKLIGTWNRASDNLNLTGGNTIASVRFDGNTATFAFNPPVVAKYRHSSATYKTKLALDENGKPTDIHLIDFSDGSESSVGSILSGSTQYSFTSNGDLILQWSPVGKERLKKIST